MISRATTSRIFYEEAQKALAERYERADESLSDYERSRLLLALLEAQRRVQGVDVNPSFLSRDSWVYFAREGRLWSDALVKIGVSRDPRGRLAQLQRNHQRTLRLVGVVPGGREVERQIHERFASSRLRGEWFRVTEELEAFISQDTYRVSQTD